MVRSFLVLCHLFSGHQAGGKWCSLKLNWKLGRATDLFESRAIAFHRRVVCQPGADLPKNIGGMGIRRFNNSIVNPFAFPAGRDHASTSQVRQMSRDFWLIYLQNFYKETYTNFVVADQINQPQTRAIRERLKEKR